MREKQTLAGCRVKIIQPNPLIFVSVLGQVSGRVEYCLLYVKPCYMLIRFFPIVM